MLNRRFAQIAFATATALTIGARAAASAPITTTVEAIGSFGFGARAGSTIIDFDSGLPAGPIMSATGSGSGLFTGTTRGLAATPFGDATQYYSTGLGTTTIAMGGDYDYLGLLWGSVDNYNNIKFYKDDVLVGTINGSAIRNPAGGDQGIGGTFYVNFEIAGGYDKVELLSTGYSFEIDDLAYGHNYHEVPAPAAALLLGGGLLGLGFARRRNIVRA